MEGMTHAKAMDLLRDTEPETLHLQLLKCGGNTGKQYSCLATGPLDVNVDQSWPGMTNVNCYIALFITSPGLLGWHYFCSALSSCKEAYSQPETAMEESIFVSINSSHLNVVKIVSFKSRKYATN